VKVWPLHNAAQRGMCFEGMVWEKDVALTAEPETPFPLVVPLVEGT